MRLLALIILTVTAASAAESLPIAAIKRTEPVQFEREILPFLKESCLACHNQTKAKADLILETPQAILKGGESGPAVTPGKPEESLLLKLASHQDKPFMPPPENKVNAPQLKAEQLGMLKLWIEQGASGEVRGENTIAWRGLAQNIRPILSLALTDDAQLAACGRGNELFIYQLPTGRGLTPLVDPDLHHSSSAKSPAAHLDLVQSLDFSPDGELLASGSYREVKLWRRQHNLPGESPITELKGEFQMLSTAPNAKRIAAITPNHQLQVWNASEKKMEHEQELPAAPQGLAWIADDRIAAANSTNIQIWTRELKLTATLPYPAASTLAGSSNHLAWANQSVVQILHVASNLLAEPFTNRSPVVALAISRDGNQLAVSGEDRTIRVVNLSDRKIVRELKGAYRANFQVRQLERALSRAGIHAAYRKSGVEKSEKERKAQVERVRKASESVGAAQKAFTEQQGQVTAAKNEEGAAQKELAALQAKLKETREAADNARATLTKAKAEVKETKLSALEAKLDELATLAAQSALASNTLALLQPDNEKHQKAAEEKIKAAQKKISDAEALMKRGELTNAATENELHFAIAAAQNAADDLNAAQNYLQLADADRKQNEMQLEAARNAVTNSLGVTRTLAFSPDGSVLAAGFDNSIRLWSAETGVPLDSITLQKKVEHICFSGSGTVVSWSGAEASAWKTVPGWKLERTIALLNGAPAFADRVNALRFSPDGQFLATGGGEPSRSGEVKIWRVRDGQLAHEFKTLHSDTVLALAYSADGRYLASGGADRFAKVTELASGKLVRTLEGHTHHVLALGWRADGHTLVTGGADNLIKFWDALSGEKKKNPEALGKEVSAIGYIAETDQILASSGDGTLRIIKENGEKVRTFEGTSGFLQAAAASADGSLVLAGGEDGTLRVWQTETGKLLANFATR